MTRHIRASLLTVTVLMFTKMQTSSSQDVDGGWSDWALAWSPCSKSCEGGLRYTLRSCSNPTPSGNGLLCAMQNGSLGILEKKVETCNNQTCWNNEWTEWSECQPNCTDKAVATRMALCGTELCTDDQFKIEKNQCNSWNKTACPSPCEDVTCPEYAVCKDVSDDTAPKSKCVCTMGYEMRADGKKCIEPPPTTPTPRPIPTLPAAQKVVATIMSKSASTILIIFVSITLALFLLLRIFTPDRIIQMNMEIALLMAHVFLMFPASTTELPQLCKIISILIHFFFTACYAFVMLEALHMFSLVAYVVKKNGMLSVVQNLMCGWGIAVVVVLVSMSFQYDDYGGLYHCWLKMDTPLIFGNFIPVIVLIIITFTLIEGAGATEYAPLNGVDEDQRFSAKISQRSNLIILPLIFAHWLVGMLSEYEQNMALYGIFSILNGITGFVVFFFHSTGNQHVRAKLKAIYKKIFKR